jgi:maleylacetoacetate isomerase
VAILQYLDDAYPQTQPLLPADPLSRAHVRIISDCIAAGIQPLQNVTILDKLNAAGMSGLEFAKEMISSRFAELELILKETSGKYCVGDEVTMADVCLVPQVYNAVRYGVDVAQFPLIHRINTDLLKLAAFADGHPDRQPDAPAK